MSIRLPCLLLGALGVSGAVSAQTLVYRVTSSASTIDSISDLSGDGKRDLLVATPATPPFSTASTIELRSGANGALINGASVASPSGDIKLTIAAVGDVTADGVEDFALGQVVPAPGGIGQTGTVWVYSGANFAAPGTPTPYAQIGGVYAPGYIDFNFGWAVAGLGDLDGDGFGEIAVGAPYFRFFFTDPPTAQRGYVSVWSVAGGTAVSVNAWTGAGPFDHLGSSIAGMRSADCKDAVSDFVVGAPGVPTGLGTTGAVHFYGGASVYAAGAPSPITSYTFPTTDFGFALDAISSVDPGATPARLDGVVITSPTGNPRGWTCAGARAASARSSRSRSRSPS